MIRSNPHAGARGPWMRIAFQIAGFLGGVALLGWCVKQAASESNRASLGRLRETSPADASLLVGLTVLTLLVNGMIFWSAIRPVRRLPISNVLATNAVASFLSYAPFKLSILFRFYSHRAIDGVPLLTIGAWFAAVTVGISAATNPVFFASLLRREIDGLWFAAVVGGLVASHILVCVLTRTFAGDRGMARLRRLAGYASHRLAASSIIERVHDGFDMLANPVWLAVQMTLRATDLFIIAARLYLCAKILGVSVSFSESIVYGAFRFAVATVAPTGAVGTQEGVTAWIAKVLHAPNAESYAAILVLMLAVEAAVNLFGAAAGVLWLGPGRLLRSGSPAH